MNYQLNTLGRPQNCGWVCRQLNRIAGVVSVISVVVPGAGLFFAALTFITAQVDNNLMGRSATFEPTPQEETYMNGFAEKLAEFIKTILTELNNNYTNITVVNKQLAKMSIVADYFRLNERQQLSDNAVNIRLQVINTAFQPIRDEIQAKNGTLTGMPIAIIAQQSDFKNLFLSSAQGQSYNVSQYKNNALSIRSGAISAGTLTVKPAIKTTVFPVEKVTLPLGSGNATTRPTVQPITSPAPAGVVTSPNISTMPTIRPTVQPITSPAPAGVVTSPNISTTPTVRPTVQPITNPEPAGVITIKNPITAPANPFLPTSKPKVLSSKKINVDSIVLVDGTPMGNVNVTVEGITMFQTKADGKFSLKNIAENADVVISFVGFTTLSFEASKVPQTVNLKFEAEELKDVQIKANQKKKNNLFLILLLVGIITYGGYRYSIDKKTNKVIKTKI